MPSKRRSDWLALVLSLTAIAASYLVADRVFERIPHIEDEMAYVWQAQVFAQGKLMLSSPPDPQSMMVPFVVDYHGQRFGKYPPGWPMLLAFGVWLHARDWVNPLLAGLGLWLTYLLGKKLFDERIGLIAALLTLTSPFFLLNSGSLLSHAWSLVLSLSFALAWFDSLDAQARPPKWLTMCVAGFSLGLLALTRPLTAVGVALPFFVHGIILLIRGDRSIRLRVLAIGSLAAAVAALVIVWQFAVTGDPLLNPYTLWWKYDKIGFGPGYGREPGGHNLDWAWINLKSSMATGWRDFFGWGSASWLFLPFGVWALGKNWRAWLAAMVFPALILVYMAYWIGSTLYGPRYYYEGFYSLTLVSAAGMLWLAEKVVRAGRARRWMQVSTLLLGIFLVGFNLTVYLPKRLNGMVGLYGINRTMLQPFETPTAQALTPALVVVHFQNEWTEYGGLLALQNADLTSPFIFALSRSAQADAALPGDYPDRRIIYYYPSEPNVFYENPK